ncbi:hypothetical protein BGZ60DRAFT_404796 [Tricladium varicosporioides]|nr:hypothetical protein BGZ60DRAFT_404796 [Hymenoscyphus varicosporioides]
MLFSTFATAILASVAAATPILTERADNCTTYSSIDAGTVCYHTPSDCSATYLVKSGDSCNAIATLFGNFTLTQFYYWNPDITQTCAALRAFVPVCINTPWYTFTPPVFAPAGTVVPSSAIPVPIMPQIVSTCTKYEFVGNGLRVDAMVAQNGITMAQFLAWNPAVDKTNPSAWAGYWVCVGSS